MRFQVHNRDKLTTRENLATLSLCYLLSNYLFPECFFFLLFTEYKSYFVEHSIRMLNHHKAIDPNDVDISHERWFQSQIRAYQPHINTHTIHHRVITKRFETANKNLWIEQKICMLILIKSSHKQTDCNRK